MADENTQMLENYFTNTNIQIANITFSEIWVSVHENKILAEDQLRRKT